MVTMQTQTTLYDMDLCRTALANESPLSLHQRLCVIGHSQGGSYEPFLGVPSSSQGWVNFFLKLSIYTEAQTTRAMSGVSRGEDAAVRQDKARPAGCLQSPLAKFTKQNMLCTPTPHSPVRKRKGLSSNKEGSSPEQLRCGCLPFFKFM